MNTEVQIQRRLPIGAEVVEGGVHFRVWAPNHRRVEIIVEGDGSPVTLTREEDSYHSGFAEGVEAGALYRFRLDDSEKFYPDPASRFQPEGPHGPSQVVDPRAFHWTDQNWRGIGPAGQVLYEMHIGTFTREGTFAAAEHELSELKDLGITCIDVMPVADFAGRFGWGYDGVDLFAPTRLYGNPDDFRRFINRAHEFGMAVILDVVYNHLGPDGNYLPTFSKDYFTDKHKNDWGQSINFDGPNNGPVREFYTANARYWIEEYHLDGFRFDATQAILDDSPEHILAVIAHEARRAAGSRSIYLVNENEPQHTCLVRPPEKGGYGLDALWNDDFHHSAMVALTRRNEAYYSDTLGRPQEFISAAKWGYLYQGQNYSWQKKRRGTPAFDLPSTAFVHFLQNHDQVANSGFGMRAHFLTSPAQLRAMTALLLLMPQTPMLFQGQEFAASSHFYYFADHTDELSKLVCNGRAKELSQFPSAATPEAQAALANPCVAKTFEFSKLDLSQRNQPGHREIYKLHKDLLRLRREDPVFGRIAERGDIDGSVLGHEAFVLRYFGDEADRSGDRLLVVNLGSDLRLVPAPEPLLAPPVGQRWRTLWSSESIGYGGTGTPEIESESGQWHLPGRSAVVLSPKCSRESD